jgi:hypothetical protein
MNTLKTPKRWHLGFVQQVAFAVLGRFALFGNAEALNAREMLDESVAAQMRANLIDEQCEVPVNCVKTTLGTRTQTESGESGESRATRDEMRRGNIKGNRTHSKTRSPPPLTS